MFNIFSHDKKLAQTQQFEKMKEKFIRDEMNRKKLQDEMSKKYKKRVENFVVQMAEKPVVNHDFVPAVVKIRDEDPSKFLGPSSIAIRTFKHEKDRIKENIQNYKDSQGEDETQVGYVGAPFEFRKRNLTKEIQPMMRFTSKTNFERVANRLKVFMQNPNSDTRALARGAENLSDSFILELSKNPQATNKYLATHLLPDMNAKTHFKATYSLCLGLPDALTDKNILTERRKTERAIRFQKENQVGSARAYNIYKNRSSADITGSENHNTTKGLPPIRQPTMAAVRFEEEEKAREAEKKVHIETINPVDVSKTVLEKCNIIRPKREGIKTLAKGAGHLMSMSEKNLEEVYQYVYGKKHY